ncbi:MAG: glycosyl transferase family 2, partial [Alphaproteobacteria bacterium]|nr:glycosyl transferase family 2 [Alphaproteobacteria bacterium]
MRSALSAVALLACVHAGLWALGRSQIDAPGFEGPLPSVSYAPFEGAQHPDKHQASAARIRADLRVLAPVTRAVRTYSSTGGVELVPGIANE